MWGGWDLFQKLLLTLKSIAKKYDVSIEKCSNPTIFLPRTAVAGVIIGDRLGIVITEMITLRYSILIWISRIVML